MPTEEAAAEAAVGEEATAGPGMTDTELREQMREEIRAMIERLQALLDRLEGGGG